MNVIADSYSYNAERIDLCALSGQNKTSCLLEYMCAHCYLSDYLPNPQMPFEIMLMSTILN